MLLLARAYFLLACVVHLCTAEDGTQSVVSIELTGFNYEISKRTEDVVNIYLDRALPPVKQTRLLFEQGVLTRDNFAAVKRNLFLQVQATTNINSVTINLDDGHLLGYMQGPLLVDTTASSGPCFPSEPMLTPTTRCMTVYLADKYGNPVAQIFEMTLDSLASSFWSQALASDFSWLVVGKSDMLEPSIMFAGVLRDVNGTSIGMVTSTLLLSAFDNFLHDNFADQDNRVVFIVADNLDLMGASVPDVSFDITLVGGLAVGTPIKAYNCSNERIRMAGQFMQSLGSLNGTEGVMFVHSDQFIQINQVSRLNLKWYVVVVRPVDARNDYITSSSTTFLGACVVCGVTFVLCCFVLSWVWKHRHMKLWSYAQPRILLALIACHILCVVFGVLVVVGPTQAWCRARVFVGAVAVTCANTAILGKVLYLYVLDSPIEALAGRKSAAILSRSAILLVVLVAVQILVLALQVFGEIGGAVEANSYYSQSNGELVLRKECANHGSDSGMAQFQTVLIGLVCVLSCCFAFLTRTASVSYAESRGLLVVALQAAGLSVGFVCVEFFGTVRQGVMVSLLELMAVVWFVAISQAIMFVPRMFRQLTAGDLTLAELREMIQRHSTNTKQRQASNGLL